MSGSKFVQEGMSARKVKVVDSVDKCRQIDCEDQTDTLPNIQMDGRIAEQVALSRSGENEKDGCWLFESPSE